MVGEGDKTEHPYRVGFSTRRA